MALFKILRGDSSRIDTTTTPFHDGYAYYTPDDGGFYIDATFEGENKRTRINPVDIEIVHIDDSTNTISHIENIMEDINNKGHHAFLDLSEIDITMRFCAFEIFHDGEGIPTTYRLSDLNGGKTAIGEYTPSKTIGQVVSEAVGDFVNLIVSCSDGIGQTVTIRSGDETGPVYATAVWEGQPITFTLPVGFHYCVEGSVVGGYVTPEPVKGFVAGNTAMVSLVYYLNTKYSFHISGSLSDPKSRVTYIGDISDYTPARMNATTGIFDYGSWSNAFFMPRPCMLKYDGTVDYYLDENDYSKKADGTPSDIANDSYEGNAMMEWGQNGKKIWLKISPDADGSGADITIAQTKFDENYTAYPFIDADGNQIDHFYTPIYNGTVVGSRLRSISGKPYTALCQSKNASTEISLANANNVNGKTEWNTEVFCDIQLINILLVLMGKSTDTQSVFGTGRSNQASAAENMLGTGTMNDKGLFWGAFDNGVSGVKVFGMENWWGNQWRRYAGHVNANGIQKVKLCYGISDGSETSAYNLDGSGYIEIPGATPEGSSGGYISKMVFTDKCMVPKTASGSSSTYYCDGLWFNNSQTDYAYRGGYCYSDAGVGAFSCVLGNTASYARWSVGAAISCKPLA